MVAAENTREEDDVDKMGDTQRPVLQKSGDELEARINVEGKILVVDKKGFESIEASTELIERETEGPQDISPKNNRLI